MGFFSLYQIPSKLDSPAILVYHVAGLSPVATIPFPLVPGFTALHETAAHGFREAATLLLANGRAPTNMRDARGADFSPRKVVDLYRENPSLAIVDIAQEIQIRPL